MKQYEMPYYVLEGLVNKIAIIPSRQGQLCTWYDKIITWIGWGSSLQFQLSLGW